MRMFEEQRSVVRFLWGKGLATKGIHKEMFSVYSGKYLLPKVVHNWVEKFSQGRLKFPGCPVEIAIEATVQQVEEFIQAVRNITIDSVATVLGCFHGSAYSIMHESLKVSESVHMVGAQRTEGLKKMNCMGLSLQHLLQYVDEGEDVLNRTVTRGKSWVHHYQPTNQSMLHCNGNIPVHLKPKSLWLCHQLGTLCLHVLTFKHRTFEMVLA
jgi:hypothetical protein